MTAPQPNPWPTSVLPAILYLAAGVILIDQLAILFAAVLPPAPGAVQWRFGAVGLAAGRATPFLLADVMLLLGGYLGSHRGLLRALGFLHLFLAPLLVAVLGLFVLDTMEIRQTLPIQARGTTLSNAARAAIALLVTGGFAIWIGLKVLRHTPSRSSLRSADRRIVIDSRGTEAR